jgi:hypothetical protein
MEEPESISAEKLQVLRGYYEHNPVNTPVDEVYRQLQKGSYTNVTKKDIQTGLTIILMDTRRTAPS